MATTKTWIKWRKLNTLTPTYVSTYPAGAWKIVRVADGWSVQRAAKDGDAYVQLHRLMTLSNAKQYANDWTPE